jgi:hypothetical protein
MPEPSMTAEELIALFGAKADGSAKTKRTVLCIGDASRASGSIPGA